MDRVVLKDTIDILSRVVSIPEEKKKELVEKYASKSDIIVIRDLAQMAYRVLGNDSELYDYVLEILRSMNPQICPSVSEMKERLRKMFANEMDGNMSMEDNHKIVNDSLVKVTTLLPIIFLILLYVVGDWLSFLTITFLTSILLSLMIDKALPV